MPARNGLKNIYNVPYYNLNLESFFSESSLENLVAAVKTDRSILRMHGCFAHSKIALAILRMSRAILRMTLLILKKAFS